MFSRITVKYFINKVFPLIWKESTFSIEKDKKVHTAKMFFSLFGVKRPSQHYSHHIEPFTGQLIVIKGNGLHCFVRN